MASEIVVGCGEWGFRELPLEEHFRIANELGFRYLEFGIGGGQTGRLPDDLSNTDITDFKALAQEYGLVTPFCCIENDFTLPDAAAHDAMVEQTLTSIRLAARCGATHVRLFAGFTPADEVDDAIWSRMIHAFEKTDTLCRQNSMQVAIETHGKLLFQEGGEAIHVHTVSTEPSSVRRLLANLPPTVGFNYDPGNLKALAPDDRSYCLDLLDPRINYCHLKDWKRQGDGWVAVAIGDDDLDYGPLIRSMSFDGVYLIEYEPLHDVFDGIRRSLAYLDRIAPGHRMS